MLKRLHLQNFTVFADADFEFGSGLNVLVGTNGTGKSHVLKVGYALEDAKARVIKETAANNSRVDWAWQGGVATSLHMVFSSPGLVPLIRWNIDEQTLIEAAFKDDEAVSFGMRLSSRSNLQEGIVNTSGAQEFTTDTKAVQPVFIPAKEILTLSWMLPGSEQIIAPVEKHYLDLLRQLRLLPLRKPEVAQSIQSLTEILGGDVREEGDKYFLVNDSGRRTAINLVAEGLRKFGTLQKLLANGSLTKQTTLYWDEPEANLNPALLQKLAAILAELARQGFQIILATHSTDLLKEFHILSRQKDAKPLPIKYFGLNAKPGEATTVITTDNFEHLPDVVALEVELKQADELEEIFIREDREYYANHPGEQPSL